MPRASRHLVAVEHRQFYYLLSVNIHNTIGIVYYRYDETNPLTHLAATFREHELSLLYRPANNPVQTFSVTLLKLRATRKMRWKTKSIIDNDKIFAHDTIHNIPSLSHAYCKL